tara:strand:+ start:9543 stop:12308 length:2766 start_codon:yes stop_codon:yes gene_type:complete
MAKVKINKLPEGFELVDGKLNKVSKKQYGGDQTGDQSDYGLVTTPQEYYGQTNFNNNLDSDVRFSLGKVPRDEANVEAEGGETVLTDLNGDNQFGLYNITGPRHSSGGVPMFLPEQSFIYSDTNVLKFNKDEMAEFGIESGKRKTPAQISKKYPLNQFFGAINDQYADDISTLSAELMLNKNMKGLSKLAYGQELKKKFEDGVPLAAYPYLVSKGVDPIQFTAQVEEISQKQAQLNAFNSLPPQQQEQMMMLQNLMAQMDQQQQPANNMPAGPETNQQGQQQLAMANQQMDQQMMAKYGNEINKYQRAGETGKDYAERNGQTWDPTLKNPTFDKENQMWEYEDGTPSVSKSDAMKMAMSGAKPGPEYYISQDEGAAVTTDTNRKKLINPLPKTSDDYDAFQSIIDRHNKGEITATLSSKRDPQTRRINYSIVHRNPNPLSKRAVEYITTDKTVSRGKGIDITTQEQSEERDKINELNNAMSVPGILSKNKRDPEQPKAGDSSYGYDFSEKRFEDDMTFRWGDAWKGGQFEGANGEMITIDPVENFDYSLPRGGKGSAYRKQWKAVQKNMQTIDDAHSDRIGVERRVLFSGKRQGEKQDGKFGLHTFNIDRRFVNQGQEETLTSFVDESTPDLKTPPEFFPPSDEPWLQDKLNIYTQNSLDNPLILPVNPSIPRQKIDYALYDWKGKVNNINAALNSKLQNLGAFAGKAAVAGADFGKAVALGEKAINDTQSANVGVINQIAPMQARMDMENNITNLKLRMDQDAGTNLALQRFTDFENWDKQKSGELLNNLITNAANTYNLNMTKKPQFRIDSGSGGYGAFTGITNPLQQQDMTSEGQRRYDEFLAIDQKLREDGIEDPEVRFKAYELIYGNQSAANNTGSGPNEFETYNPGTSTVSSTPPAQRGKEKRRAFPFSIGQMGR